MYQLARGDRQVHELCALLGEQQSLISYHLGQLRKADLVEARRSAADARDSYYVLKLGRCIDLLADVGGLLHAGLRVTRPAPPSDPRSRVLFLCTGNSARSQMAEALLRTRSGDAVSASSAGSRPKPVHPFAIAAMADRGIDVSTARAKHLDEYANDSFDYVITLCDRVREVCPDFPGHPLVAHWSIRDPAAEPDTRSAFDRVAAELAERIGFLLHAIAANPAPEAS
jgi:protein-tyrosine-phosphatase/DNA-binding transcriptional ArsR family regulator